MAGSLALQSNAACLSAEIMADSSNAQSEISKSELPQSPEVVAPDKVNSWDSSESEKKADQSTDNSAQAKSTTSAVPEKEPEPSDTKPSASKFESDDSSTPALSLKPSIAQSPQENQFILRGGASVSPMQSVGEIDQLTKAILLKEIELQRYNLHYTIEVAKQGRWKGWRYAGLQEINSGLNLSGSIISVVNRGSNIHRAQGVKLHPQLAANYIPMIGSIIGTGAAAGEFAINQYHDLIARKHGYSPAAAIKHVQSLKDEINALIAKRDALIKIEASDPNLIAHVEVDEAEGKILVDVRDQALQEFERFHVGARKLLAFQQAQYFFDMAKYSTSAIGSNFAYLSLHRKARVWNGRAGVMFIISGQLTMWGPIASRVFAKGVGELTKKRVRPVVEDAEQARIATLQEDVASLDRLIKRGTPQNIPIVSATDRQAHYIAHDKAFSSELDAAEKKNAAAKLTATQNIGAGIIVGGAKTASGVLFVVPGFDKNYNSKTVRAGRVTNDLLFTAAVVSIPSTSFAMLDTLRIQVRGELNRQKAKKAGALPGQIVAARLKDLDSMEQRLKQ